MVAGKKFNDCVKRDICGAMQGESMAGQFGEEGWIGFIFILSGIASAALCVCPHKRSRRKKASFMKPPLLQCYNVTMLQCYNVTMLQC